ncbi:glycosyltransferase [Thalassotalea agarivorans]|uniref:Glycosyltransferase involved in cell wall bisynthesis n=1 Tax=Thalassotalea agarivorans TaxID=349064 RepID=A0A1H9Y221_THASX|nr:glycosyltransferase [Thalassotalea agarivorans]SES62854.1 Glycosyltransferase involved in cell wall bisynthesis [Thalassotalea agarivorans]
MKSVLFFGNDRSPLSNERFMLLRKSLERDVYYFAYNKLEIRNDDKVISSLPVIFNLSVIRLFAMFFLMGWFLFRKQISVIHFHGASTVFCSLYSFLPRTKIITTPQGSDINQNFKGYRKLFTWLLLKNSNVITAKSKTMAKRVYEIASKQAKILNWGLADEVFEFKYNPSESDKKIKFLSPRGGSSIYNLDLIFKAIAQLKRKHRNIEFTYIDFNKKEQLELDKSIVDIEYKDLNKKEFYAVLSKNDFILSLPSHDGFSTTIMEALAVGSLPVISDIPAYKAEFDERENIVSKVSINNISVLVAHLEELIAAIADVRAGQKRRTLFAYDNYSLEMQVAILKAIYHNLNSK